MVFIQKSLGEMVLIGSESESRPVMSDSLQPHGLFSPWNSPGQNTGVGSLSFLQSGEGKYIVYCKANQRVWTANNQKT